METWIKTEIAIGLKRLVTLRLEHTPSARVIRYTLDEWCAAVSEDRTWISYRDAPRFRQAFSVLVRTRRSWPAPADFIAAVPELEIEVPPPQRLPKKDLRRALQSIEVINEMLSGKVAAAGPDE